MPNKYYLTIGINKYSGAPLNGCVNDANDWAAFLKQRGYSGMSLLDGGATSYSIKHIITDMVAQLRYRDTLVITFSGHGSWVPDMSGDEPDGRDEVWCAYDYESGGLVTDDDLHRLTKSRVYGSKVIIFSDSCHSGSVHRFAQAPEGSATPDKLRRVRYMPPGMFLWGNALQRANEAQSMELKSTLSGNRGTVLMSGCKDDEYSYDAWIGGRYNGAFTANALFAYQDGLSMKKWHHQIVPSRLPTDMYPQTPQLQGTWYQTNFWKV